MEKFPVPFSMTLLRIFMLQLLKNLQPLIGVTDIDLWFLGTLCLGPIQKNSLISLLVDKIGQLYTFLIALLT